MKLTFSILVFLTSTAAAGTVTLQTVSSATVAPKLVASEALCTDDADRIRTTRSKFAGHEVAVLHQCGMSDENTELAFELGDGTFRTYTSGEIAYRAANMTEASMDITLLTESLVTT